MRTTGEEQEQVEWERVDLDPWPLRLVIVLLAGIAAVGLVVERRRRSRTGTLLELGAVSKTWIAEQQSNRRLDR